MKRLHIRGNMGTQILQAALVCSLLEPTDEAILCVNHGNLDYDGTNKIDLFFNSNLRIVELDTMNKTPYWVSGAAEQIFTNRDRIFRWLEPKLNKPTHTHQAVHIRVGDKTICSDDSYRKLIQHAYDTADDRVLIYTNDAEYLEALDLDSKANIEQNTPFVDWCELYNASKVWASPSSFVMSMLLFDPEKHIVFTGDALNDGGYDVSKDMLFLREAMEFCPNVEIWNG